MAVLDRVKSSPLAQQATTAWEAMPKARRVIAVGTAVVVLGMLGWVIVRGSEVNYVPLAQQMDPVDAGAVRDALDKKGIPYELGPNNSIAVPEEHIHRARIDVAQAGIPAGGPVGFEIFDDQKFWSNTFTQRVNLLRALEGELTRSVVALEGVKKARVHLVIPERHVFKDDRKPPTASVSIRTKPGHSLTAQEIRGVQLLVKSGVEGLDEDNVTVIVNGKPANARSTGGGESIDFQRKLESDMEQRIVSMLEPVVGRNRVIARVSANVDLTSARETIEEFDPDGQVARSTREVTETQSDVKPKAAGVPGARGTQEGVDPAVSSRKSQRSESIVNNEINKTVRHTDRPAGELRRLSVAVLLDRRERPVMGEDDEPAPSVHKPFTPEELKGFRTTIESAVGFDPKRGDRVEVTNMEFSGIEEEAMISEPLLPPELMKRLLDWGFALILLTALYFAVVRPLLKRTEPVEEAAEAPGTDLVAGASPAEQALAAAEAAEAAAEAAEAGSLGEPAQLTAADEADQVAEGTIETDGEPLALAPADAALAVQEQDDADIIDLAAREAAERAEAEALARKKEADVVEEILAPSANEQEMSMTARMATTLRKRAIELTRADPKRAARVLRDWLSEEQHVEG